ncbi:MAG TPA: hypothetical protein VME69_06175 [Methylocella sp.]|nr:hypothetical protein [Methylocella sp.]
MSVSLDLADIQGNILTGYGRAGFPKGRFLLFHVDRGDVGRHFVLGLLPSITTAQRWNSKQAIPTGKAKVERPLVAVNIAFTWYGLLALGVPVRTLQGMPDEFIDGMAKRASLLGDDFVGPNWRQSWDEVWIESGNDNGSHPDTVHILVALNAQMKPDGTPVEALETRTHEIEALAQRTGGVRLLTGHNRKGQPKERYQELSAILRQKEDGTCEALPKEHFGFTDGIGDPVFEGQYPDGYEEKFKTGNGALDGQGHWRPIATGEFLLGYPDEAQELPPAAGPLTFSRNGTFMAYRKVRQHVAAFQDFINKTAEQFGAVFGLENPDEARETLLAKLAGRWTDGVPVSAAPTFADWKAFNSQYPESNSEARYAALTHFSFKEDPKGLKCPMTAHLRRVNTRDQLDPTGQDGSVINNRRRILRRGLPYTYSPDGSREQEEQGLVLLFLCASLFRQFEFVQQQWINNGMDANAGSDTCPITGNHSDGQAGLGPKAKFVIPSDPASGRPPFIVEGLPQFIETRGGDYFFVPSLTALRMIGLGIIDPT